MIQGILGRPVKTEIAQKPAKTEHVLMGFAIVSHLSQGSSVNLSSVKMTADCIEIDAHGICCKMWMEMKSGSSSCSMRVRSSK